MFQMIKSPGSGLTFKETMLEWIDAWVVVVDQ